MRVREREGKVRDGFVMWLCAMLVHTLLLKGSWCTYRRKWYTSKVFGHGTMA